MNIAGLKGILQLHMLNLEKKLHIKANMKRAETARKYFI